MLLGPSILRASRSLLIIGSVVGIVATSLLSVHKGQLTLTLDLAFKLLITFAYTHGFRGTRTLFSLPKALRAKSPEEEYSILPQTRSSLSDKPHQKIVATVVGWREDESLYRTCLEGFRVDEDCGPIIAGIDGDTIEDEDMVKIFLTKFPGATVIRLKEPLSRRLEQYMLSARLNDVEDEQTRAFIMDHMSSSIRRILEEELFPRSIKDIQALCVVQPHQSKKDILFTALSFAGVLADVLELPYLFSTDSDSTIIPGALSEMVKSLDSDENIGGVSGHLRFRNPRPTYITRITASHYWFEQQIPKAQGATFGATECQPGPCAAFRVSVLQSILVPWYCQTFFGRKTITNEDRHLTTRILWAGFSVHYAPGAIVCTDAPQDFDSWVKQQVRWSRGTMIETLWYPWMINKLSPWHIYNIMKDRVVPLATFWCITSYALGLGNGMTKLNGMMIVDIFCSTAIQVTYVVHMSPDHATTSDIIWLVPAALWFFIMEPGIVVWSLLTMWDGSWGNQPRAMNWRLIEGKDGGNGQLVTKAFSRIMKMKHVAFQLLWIGIVFIAAVRASLTFLLAL